MRLHHWELDFELKIYSIDVIDLKMGVLFNDFNLERRHVQLSRFVNWDRQAQN